MARIVSESPWLLYTGQTRGPCEPLVDGTKQTPQGHHSWEPQSTQSQRHGETDRRWLSASETRLTATPSPSGETGREQWPGPALTPTSRYLRLRLCQWGRGEAEIPVPSSLTQRGQAGREGLSSGPCALAPLRLQPALAAGHPSQWQPTLDTS